MENINDINTFNLKKKPEKIGLIKKYPFNGRSKFLIDKFYIIGYEPNQLYKLLILNDEIKKTLSNAAKKIKAEESQNNSNITKLSKNSLKIPLKQLPSLLNEISNDYQKILPDIDLINSILFPNDVNIYIKSEYNKFSTTTGRTTTLDNFFVQKTKSSPMNLEEEENLKIEKFGRESVNVNLLGKENDESNLKKLSSKQYNIIFSYNPQIGNDSKKSINGYAYVFYKKYIKKLIIEDVTFTFYVPMTFCIMSEFPFFNSYYKLCQQIVDLFQSKQQDIPIEIILYNIINFSLSPINGDVMLNIEPVNFPSEKTVVESISKMKKEKEFGIIKEEESDDEINNYDLYEDKDNEEDKIISSDKYLNQNKLKKINEKFGNKNNASPEIKKAHTILKKVSTEKKPKGKNVKFDKKNSNISDGSDLESSISISPELSIKKRKLDIGNKIIDNTRFTISIKNNMGFGDEDEDERYKKVKSRKNSLSNFEDIKFPSLSGFPLIQYNLSKVLLHNLSPQDVIIIFLYSFLEKDILFFSKNLEYLSFTINSYLNLNFPLNDEKYYYFNACVSYNNFINDNSPFVGTTFTSILGINGTYNSDYLSKAKLKDHLVVDLDNGVIYQIDDPNDKDKNARNKLFFDYIKKICKKELKDDKNILLVREIKILYDKLESYKNNNNSETGNNTSSKMLIKISKKANFINYDEKGENSIKNKNRSIQEGFYRFINYMCLYFYQNLSLKSDDDKENLDNIIINRKNKELNADTMNIIFHKDYNNEENNYTKEELYFLDELIETMKFESFVYGFIQSYNPIDLYKIPLTLTEEFISILSRKNFVKNHQNINFFPLFDNLYKKNGNEKVYIDFNPFYVEYYKKIKNYFDREIYDENNCNNFKKIMKQKYLKVELSKRTEGTTINNLKYDEYILDNNLLIKYIRFLRNLKLQEYYHMFHLASSLEQNNIKNISVTDIENEIEKYSYNVEISSKKDMCCSNIILLFILSLKSIKNYIDCQTFLSALFQNFNVFRKYYTMIMNLVYRLMNDCLDKKDYSNAQNYFLCYYSCINSLRSLKLVPNENLIKIISKFDKIDFDDLLEKANQNNSIKDKAKIEEKKPFFNDKNIKESNQTKYAYIIYNFTKNSFIKEESIVQKVNELKGKKTLKINLTNKEGKISRSIEPKIKFNNGTFEYKCLIATQDKILDDLNKQYETYITDLNEYTLNNKVLFEACLNIILFTKNTNFFQDMDDISDTFKIIFNVYLEKIYLMNNNSNNTIINKDIEGKKA